MAITAAQVGCVVSAALFEAYGVASDQKRELLTAPGRRIRNMLANVLGWDEHRRLHDPVAVWGSLLLVVALVGAGALLVLWRRRLGPSVESFLNLVGPWVVLGLIASPSSAWGAWLLIPVLLVWAYEHGRLPWSPPHGLRDIRPWSFLLSVPLWLLLLRDLSPWIAPLGWASFLVGVTRLLSGTSTTPHEMERQPS
jgi:hypothetical protein